MVVSYPLLRHCLPCNTLHRLHVIQLHVEKWRWIISTFKMPSHLNDHMKCDKNGRSRHSDTLQSVRGSNERKTCIAYTNNNNVVDCIPIICSEKSIKWINNNNDDNNNSSSNVRTVEQRCTFTFEPHFMVRLLLFNVLVRVCALFIEFLLDLGACPLSASIAC